MRILIAEDDLTSRLVLCEVLKKSGHEVATAVNGAQALQLLQQPDAPRLAILDWMMPELSGVDVCRQVRAQPTELPPYIIMLTSKSDKQDIVAGLEAGADDYLAKPFVLEELRARVEVGRRILDLQTGMANKVRELTLWQNRMVRELKVAALLQTKLLATTPLLTPSHEVRMLYQPCQLVGGDFFDALDLPDGRLCVYVGDVAGHGVGPAMIAALMKSLVSDTVRGLPACTPAEACREVSVRFREQVPDLDVYATLFIVFHNPTTGQWRAMNCGHPPPLLLDRDGNDRSAALARTGSLPVGIDAGPVPAYEERDEVFAEATPGDLLFLYTDGLLDARRRDDGSRCSMEALTRALVKTATQNQSDDYPSYLLKHIEDDGYTLSNDDCCALSVRLTLPEERVADLSLAPDGEAPASLRAAVAEALVARSWPEADAALAAALAARYAACVAESDQPPAGTCLRVQVRLEGSACRLLFSSEGRERDRPARLNELQARLEQDGPGVSGAFAARVAPACDLFRRGNVNMAHFMVPRDTSA